MFPHLARNFFLAHFAKYRVLLEAVEEVAPFLGSKSSLEDFLSRLRHVALLHSYR